MLSGSGGIGGGGRGGVWSKPPALVCHICGREYGTTSLKIHLPQCEKLWIERESLKDRRDRRPVPKPTPNMMNSVNIKDPAAMAAYNQQATQEFNQRALVACPHCGRTFFEDRLAIHLRSCRADAPAAKVGTGRIKSAQEAVAAATPIKRTAVHGGMTSPQASSATPSSALSPPPTAGGTRRSPSAASSSSSSSGSKPRVQFSSSTGGGGGPSTSRPRMAAMQTKPSSGTWEDELNDELDETPKKGYSIPPDAYPPAGGNDYGDEDGELANCSICDRRFNIDRLAKHESVCRKQQASEAKRQKRIAAKQAKLPQPGSQKSANTDAWKAKHNEFQSAIQYAKKLAAMQKAGKSLANLPPPPRSENPDYVQCPHCSRRFNQQAADRHIPACANTINKPKPVSRNGPVKAPPMGSMAAQRAAAQAKAAAQVQKSTLSPTNMRQMTQQQGMGSPYGYGDQYEYSDRPTSSSGSSMSQRLSPSAASVGVSRGRGGVSAVSSGASPPARTLASTSSAPRPRSSSQVRTGTASQRAPSVQRAPTNGGTRNSYGSNEEDLHNKINQLTQTVQQLSKVVLSSPTGGGGIATSRGGVTCRSCRQTAPSGSRFCNGCGSKL